MTSPVKGPRDGFLHHEGLGIEGVASEARVTPKPRQAGNRRTNELTKARRLRSSHSMCPTMWFGVVSLVERVAVSVRIHREWSHVSSKIGDKRGRDDYYSEIEDGSFHETPRKINSTPPLSPDVWQAVLTPDKGRMCAFWCQVLAQ